MRAVWVVLSVMVAVTMVGVTEGFRPRRILFRRCSSEERVPRAVFMTCANRRGICEVRLGHSHNLRAIFKSPINSTDVKSHVRWNTGWLELPLPKQDREACDGELQCPVVDGELTQFTYSLFIDELWPKGEFPVIWSLSDGETEDPILCFQFKIMIV